MSSMAVKAENTLAKALLSSRMFPTLTVGRFLNGLGFVGSAAGVAVSVYNYRTATDRGARVQAFVDGAYSGVGFVPVYGTFPSMAYSATQLVDQVTGLSNFPAWMVQQFPALGIPGYALGQWLGL